MANHLDHFEDALFKYGTQYLCDVLNSISDISLKWDGSPAVVAGHHLKSSGGSFISTKSYFNKVPKYYRTHEDLKQIESLGLRTKLTYLLENHPGRSDGILQCNQGDMLWWPGSFTDSSDGYRVFCPNILEYHVPLDLIGQSQDIGIVWHTDLYDGAGLFKSTDKIWSHHIEYPNQPTEQWFRPDPDFDKLITPTFSLVFYKFMMWMVTNENRLFNVEVYQDWYYNVFVPWYYGQYTSDKKMAMLTEFENSMSDMTVNYVLHTLLRIIFLKHDYLRALYADSNDIKVFVTVDGIKEEANHEGFVINSPHGSLKVVDRYQFSRLNRLDNITRGWAKDK